MKMHKMNLHEGIINSIVNKLNIFVLYHFKANKVNIFSNRLLTQFYKGLQHYTLLTGEHLMFLYTF